MVKPISSKYFVKPDLFKYSVTTFEPGDKVVLMYGLILIPLSIAFLATKPAPIMASGLEVFVHDVMAARTTEPCFNECYCPLKVNLLSTFTFSAGTPNPLNPTLLGTQAVKSFLTSESGTLSCGLLGPEIRGSTVDKSSSRTSVN